MKYFYQGVLFITFVALFIVGILFAIDIETARQDYNSGKKVENCIFERVCQRYGEK